MQPVCLEKQKLLDGDESEFYDKELSLILQNVGKIKVDTNEFSSVNKIKHLEAIIGRDEFLRFIHDNQFKGPVGVTSNYLGAFGLPLYFIRLKNHIMIYAAGEKQSTRFVVYFEGAWEMRG